MRKKKMATVTVVILVGLMAVMVVQKVKDRRLFNLVIKDKDRQILSLHLLLQKERQYAKENKRENQDLNAKLYSLVTQKIELDNKIMEMRSTIGSLRDEQRVLELEIDLKQNQIKQKETEIKDLNSSMQAQPNIWSVSSDDPSNQELNLTVKVLNPAQKPKNEQLAGLKDHKDDAKIEMNNTNVLITKRSKSEDQYEKSQVKANAYEIYQEGNTTRSVADRMDEDETEREADQDYKEETED
ncbi:hypothetical protein E3N88_02142 [Mikania micrantha]|uniref:Uncharacterized protein n=1 Tax=Mikania micrantha TaxID=192012 RepID=A0A5N6Q4M2_9ASTR|nr:hypothetical protein E3N88_02142 [Mikania micrantha]